MSRYRGPKLKIIKYLQKSLPGFTKTVFIKSRSTKIGSTKKKPSAYKLRLLEKQKLRYNYGLTERQLLKYVKQAKRRPGMTGFLILQFLEMRLDNIIFKMGLANTIQGARQMINHGHFLVNNKKINIPSFNCCVNDQISLRNKKTSKTLVENNISNLKLTNLKLKIKPIVPKLPKHLEFDPNTCRGMILDIVDREDLGIQVNELSIIEYYSRIL